MEKDAVPCVIVDDEPLALSLLGDYIQRTPGLVLVAALRDPVEALRVIQQNNIPLLFLDIQMPELTGFQLMGLLRNKCEVILTTAYPEYALDGYEHDVVDYLLKPFSFARYLSAVEKYRKRVQAANPLQPAESQVLLVKSGNRVHRLPFSDIYYLEALRDYIAIHTSNGKILTLQSLSSFQGQLPSPFARIHRSYIVNTEKIIYRELRAVNVNGITLPVSDTFENNLGPFR